MTVRRDDELATAAAAGDEAAFREIIDRYATSVYDFATRSSGDFRSGLTTTLAVFEELPTNGPSVRADLFRKARQLVGEIPELGDRSSVWGGIEDRPWPEVEDSVSATREAQQVWDAARQLDVNTYMTFDLDTQRGLSSEELAAVLGVSKGHAASAAARARETVRTAVATRLLVEGGGCDELTPLAGSPHLVQRHLVRCKECQTARSGLALPGMALPVFAQLLPPANFVSELGKEAVVAPLPKKRRRSRLFITTIAVGLVALVAAAAVAAPLIMGAQDDPVVTTTIASMAPTTTTSSPARTTIPSALVSGIPAPETTTSVPPSTTTSFPFISFPFPGSQTTTQLTPTTSTTVVTSTTAVPQVTTSTAAITTSTVVATTTTAAPTTSTTATPTTTSTTTTTTSTTAVPNNPPQPTIAWPLAGAKVCEGRVLNFSGSATDPDGHSIVAYSWTSSRDGTFATGATAQSSLSAGTHTLTFSATDAKGATGSTSIGIEVRPSSAPTCS